MTKKTTDDQPDNQLTQPTSDQVAELETQLKRVAADFENFRRRIEEERKQLVGMAQAQTLLELTPVLENFRRATAHLPEELKNNSWATGVLYVEKQLEQILEQFGLEKIKSVGEKFNPQFHEAVETVSDTADEVDTVVEEIEGGYLLNGQVLKVAKVKVAS